MPVSNPVVRQNYRRLYRRSEPPAVTDLQRGAAGGAILARLIRMSKMLLTLIYAPDAMRYGNSNIAISLFNHPQPVKGVLTVSE